MWRILAFAALAVPATFASSGCGDAPVPCVSRAVLTPANLTLDHTAAPPANQTTYAIGTAVVQGNCPVSQVLRGAKDITISDPAHIQVDNTGAVSVVTCVGATDGAAVVSTGGLSAKLTCN